jgi:hypothetical protein
LHHHVGRPATATTDAGAVTAGAADAAGAATATSPKATAAVATTEPILRDRTFTRTPPRMRAENHDERPFDSGVTPITGLLGRGIDRVGPERRKTAGEWPCRFLAPFFRVHSVE